jgi:hypothetical protein
VPSQWERGVVSAAATLTRPFRSMDIDGDGSPDEPKAIAAVMLPGHTQKLKWTSRPSGVSIYIFVVDRSSFPGYRQLGAAPQAEAFGAGCSCHRQSSRRGPRSFPSPVKSAIQRWGGPRQRGLCAHVRPNFPAVLRMIVIDASHVLHAVVVQGRGQGCQRQSSIT